MAVPLRSLDRGMAAIAARHHYTVGQFAGTPCLSSQHFRRGRTHTAPGDRSQQAYAGLAASDPFLESIELPAYCSRQVLAGMAYLCKSLEIARVSGSPPGLWEPL